MIASSLGAFCRCEDCTVDKNSQDCADIMKSDGFTQATDIDGCGFSDELNGYNQKLN